MSLLEVRNLDISFRTTENSIKVVSGVSFTIEEGEVFGLVGESGCGKTLTALSIMGILPQNAFSEGDIIFKGHNLLSLDKESMRKLRGKELSMIFQEPMTSLNPVLTVGYQVAEVLTTHKELSKKEAMSETIELFKAVRIPSPETRIKEYPHQMSGGMRQRVMIAMAIACRPSLVIADEPTTALDVTIQAQILELLQRLKKEMKMAVLLITHDLGIVSENAKTVAIMYAGRLMEFMDVHTLFHNPKHPYTMGLLESLPKEKGIPLKPIPGFVPEPHRLPPGCKFSDRCRFAINRCKEREPDLRPVSETSNKLQVTRKEQNADLSLVTRHSSLHLVRCIRAEEINWKS